MLGEEVEEAEIVPGDLGAHGLDADGVDDRRSDRAPIRANIEVIPAPDRRARC